MDNRQNEAEAWREKTVQYLEDRYPDHFSAKSYTSKNWAYPYARMTLSSQKYPTAVVEVRIYQDEDGSFRFEDNYYQYALYEDAVRFVERRAGGVSPLTVKVRFWGDFLPEDRDSELSLEELMSAGACRLDVFLITQTELPEAGRKQIVDDLSKDGLQGFVTFLTTSEAGNLASFSLEEILDNQGSLIVHKAEYRTIR